MSQAVLRHESVRARLPNFVVIISGDFTFANLNLTFCKPANDGVVYVLLIFLRYLLLRNVMTLILFVLNVKHSGLGIDYFFIF